MNHAFMDDKSRTYESGYYIEGEEERYFENGESEIDEEEDNNNFKLLGAEQ